MSRTVEQLPPWFNKTGDGGRLLVPTEVRRNPDSRYYLPEADRREIELQVDKAVSLGKQEGQFLTNEEIDHFADGRIDINGLMDNLPNGMSETEFIDIIRLAYRTEAGTDIYVRALGEPGIMYGQKWLYRYIHEFWKLDEYMHRSPFKMLLMEIEGNEEALDRDQKEVDAAEFTHGQGESPAYVSMFGNLQEFLTKKFHAGSTKVIRPYAPGYAYLTGRTTGREGIHETQYGSITAIQIARNPANMQDAAKALAEFKLPGKYVAPAQQEHATRYVALLGTNPEKLIQGVGKSLWEITQDESTAGRIAMEVAIRRRAASTPLDEHIDTNTILRVVREAKYLGLSRIVGEAALEFMGVKIKGGRQPGLYGQIEDAIKPHIVKQLENLDLGT